MIQVPDGSIYYWMYENGLKRIDIREIEAACSMAGVEIRKKDYQNYMNGWYRSDLYGSPKSIFDLQMKKRPAPASSDYFTKEYSDYPMHPYADIEYEIDNRYVPCNKNNKPMMKWGEGCLLREDAEAMPGQVYLAENLKGCKFIVIDCDGDHEEGKLDLRTMQFLDYYRHLTASMDKPAPMWFSTPVSFHLAFKVDRIIPSMHFLKAHIDICGNKENQLRYFKNKLWNHREMIPMTDEIWRDIRNYIKEREEE